jgi:hypothetical protein
MRRLVARLSATAAAAGLATAGLVAGAVPAQAAACTGTSGVTVVVDFGSSTSVRCAPGDPSSGLAALQAAGFSVKQVQRQPGFVCRIDGAPASDPCVNTPPANAYWAYFHAARGGSWSYSSLGAASYDPKPGSVEGWSFGSGGAPGTAPPAPTPRQTPKPAPKTTAPKPPAKPKATTRPTTGGGATAGSGAKATPRPGTSTAAPSGSAAPSATPSASTSASPSPSASVDPSGTPTPGDDATATPLAATPTSTGSGSGTGTLVAGAALVALVASGAGFAAWRRRT